MNCRNCGTELLGKICHQCGQKVIDQRWSTRAMFTQFLEQLTNIEHGFLYTGKWLFINPGQVIQDFWDRKTIRYFHPFRYILVWVAINLLINFWLGIDDMLQQSLQPAVVDQSFEQAQIDAADQKFDAWLNALVLLLLPVFALLTSWLFKKYRKNYAEHLIMNAYMMGQQSLITSFTHFIFYFFPALFVIYLPFNFLVGLVYNTYVLKQIFREALWKILLKAFVMGIIGLAVGFLLITLASTIALMFV